MATTTPDLRLEFFDFLFGEVEGYVCICTAPPTDARRHFRQHFFHWPSQRDAVKEFIDVNERDKNIWFCVNLLEKASRKKEETLTHNLVWADLDACDPEVIEPKPSLVIQSSPNRYQALWRLDKSVPPEVAEDYSKRIAYKYNQNGVDLSGWDLTQLLRVPFTKNMKYNNKPLVLVMPNVSVEPIELQDFEELEPAPVDKESTDARIDETMPDISELETPEKITYKYQAYLERSFYELFEGEPTHVDDWSTRMWKLLNLCFEAGMEHQEVFAIALHSKCNKYERDRRPIRFLWREVVKAGHIQQKITQVAGTWEPLLMPEIVQPEEWTTDTFIDRYSEWATEATDAVEIFHELSGAMLLSATLAGHIRIEASFGTIIPNLWGMILGESTLTRKSTAMSMAVGMLQEIDPDAILASDGSVEGLLTGLSYRPGRVSMFFKDEVSGFFDSINRKDYLAGMPETLTQLYDAGKMPYKRMLRKEEIVISNPVFLFFGGGIREKVYSLLSDQYILSGFLPRFLVVGGDADLSRIRRTGPAIVQGMQKRQKLINELLDIKERYTVQGTMRIGNQIINLSDTTETNRIEAVLSPKAWDRYGDIEEQLLSVAYDSSYAATALPTFDRLHKSMLKLAVLLAAVRQDPTGGSIAVDEQDVINAARYIQRWGRFSVDIIINAGKTQSLRILEKIRKSIEGRPGVMKSELLRQHHLSSRELNDVITNLVDRGEITRKVKGRTEQFWILN